MNWQPGLYLLSATALATLPMPALAQNPVAPVESAEAAQDNEIVCKRQKNTATRFETKVCKTRGQWNAIREQQMRDAREFIDKPSVNTARGG